MLIHSHRQGRTLPSNFVIVKYIYIYTYIWFQNILWKPDIEKGWFTSHGYFRFHIWTEAMFYHPKLCPVLSCKECPRTPHGAQANPCRPATFLEVESSPSTLIVLQHVNSLHSPDSPSAHSCLISWPSVRPAPKPWDIQTSVKGEGNQAEGQCKLSTWLPKKHWRW